jgi:hypothetical protein
VEIDIIPNKTPRADSEEATAIAEFNKFIVKANQNQNTQGTTLALALRNLLEYMKLKKKIHESKEAAARAKMMDVKNTVQEQFENAQAFRDVGWLYYYLIKYHIYKLIDMEEIPSEISAQVKKDFRYYNNEMIVQQAGKEVTLLKSQY